MRLFAEKPILIISENRSFCSEIADNVKRLTNPAYTPILSTFEAAFRHAAPFIAIIDVENATEERLGMIQHFCSNAVDIRIICAGENMNVDLVLRLVKMGVHDFLKVPVNPNEIITLLASPASENAKSPAKPVRKGHVIMVHSLKGGSGVTLLTINLAIAYAKLAKNQRVAICDFAPQCGDVATYLNLSPQYTVQDLIDNISRLDHSLLEGVMIEHESGIRVLSSPNTAQEPMTSRNLIEMQSILTRLKQDYDLIFVDAARMDHLLLEYTLSQTNTVILVGNLDVPSLKGLVAELGKLTKLHFGPSKIKIVINRYNSKNQLDIRDFERRTNHLVACKLPNNYVACIESINTGKPLNVFHGHSEIAKKIAELAQLLYADTENKDDGQPEKRNGEKISHSEVSRKGFFEWLF